MYNIFNMKCLSALSDFYIHFLFSLPCLSLIQDALEVTVYIRMFLARHTLASRILMKKIFLRRYIHYYILYISILH